MNFIFDYFNSLPADQIQWIFWLVACVVFAIAELAAPGFILIFFSFGALIAGLSAFLGLAFYMQIIIFAVASVSSLLLARKYLRKTFVGKTNDEEAVAETDPAIGMAVEVAEDIIPPAMGRVKFQGSFWSAVADEKIAAGEIVSVIARKEDNKNIFIVKKEN